MKRFLGHPLLALAAIIILGFIFQLSGQSKARASYPQNLTIDPLARLADSMQHVTLDLDVELSSMFNSGNANLPAVGPIAESRESIDLSTRLQMLRQAISLELPRVRLDAFLLSARIARQESFLGEISSLLEMKSSLLESLPTSLPAIGELTSPFGERIHPISGRRKMHTGVDIAAQSGAPIVAAGSGTVLFAGRKGGYGNVVEIDHGFGYVSRYGHASKLLVATGDQIERGQKIALVGSTGASTGPHLHFEVIVDSTRVDPLQFLGGAVIGPVDGTAIAMHVD